MNDKQLNDFLVLACERSARQYIDLNAVLQTLEGVKVCKFSVE